MYCPICNQWHDVVRYKNAVCVSCLSRYGTKDRHGSPKEFFNVDASGGITPSDVTCYVNGVRCRAEEHRFGGIVILFDSRSPEG